MVIDVDTYQTPVKTLCKLGQSASPPPPPQIHKVKYFKLSMLCFVVNYTLIINVL